jgi:putative heme iron utilization protein
MDAESRDALVKLIREQRIAALGTLREGFPEVSMVPVAVEPDGSAFYFHASALAHHTQNILREPRVSLMLSEPDDWGRDPQTLARIAVRGEARALPREGTAYERVRAMYLERFPESAAHFALGDFALYRIEPVAARYVAGFGRIFNLSAADIMAGVS